MFQVIQQKKVYVVDLTERPWGEIHSKDDPELVPYAEALNQALENGLISKPGKYGIHIDLTLNTWSVFEIIE